MPYPRLKAAKINLLDFFRLQDKSKKLSLALIFSGSLLIILSLSWRFYQARVLSFTKDYQARKAQNLEQKRASPASINISKIRLNMPIKEASIKDGVWEIWYEGGSHFDQSANPGEGGNVVIYGHNKDSLFGPVRWLKEGDLIEIENSEGKNFTYKISKTVITSPEDISYVLPKEEEVLTLYTCTGFIDSKRHIIVAHPVLDF